ncbi:hypothetical protein [Mycetocola zhujimingii]|uniref:hypothetical protein n=1 Tax=Mycetocola zhujimingii TaxID=2079792 RepID=UPI0013C40FEC|nr:hypothetical protein [Mycetocola zhujimingii]
MTDFESESFIADARKYANAATFAVQQLREDSIERQAIHELLNAVDALIQAVDHSAETS